MEGGGGGAEEEEREVRAEQLETVLPERAGEDGPSGQESLPGCELLPIFYFFFKFTLSVCLSIAV